MTVAERLWEKVDRGSDDDCWIWTGATSGGGYGRIYVNGRSRPAHRIAWEITHGRPFPEGMDACHTCDHPSCVNPDHIFPGTPSDNAKDAVRKGRFLVRSNQNTAKTECSHGHPFTEENTYTWPVGSPMEGRRGCRECRRILRRRHRDLYNK